MLQHKICPQTQKESEDIKKDIYLAIEFLLSLRILPYPFAFVETQTLRYTSLLYLWKNSLILMLQGIPLIENISLAQLHGVCS